MKRTLALLISVLLPLFSSFGEDNKPLTATYIAGPGEFSAAKVRLSITGDTLAITGKLGRKKHVYYVPLRDVTLMTHSPARFNRAGQVSRNIPDASLPNMGSCSGLGCAGNVLVFLAWATYETGRYTAVGVAATRHGQRHFITIDWQEQGIERELLVEAPKDNYADLIRRLESASGKRVFDFQARWAQVQEELKREKDHTIRVVLSKRVRVGDLSLAPGAYSVVALSRDKDLAELYFFEGKLVDSTSLRGVAVVSIETATGASLKEAEVDYTTSTPAQIQEIRTPTKSFRMVDTSAPPK